MTKVEKVMALVQGICTSATKGTDCRGLSLSGQAKELLEVFGIPSAKIWEVPVYWDEQVNIIFATEDHPKFVYCLAVGEPQDGVYFEELTKAPATDGYIEFENETELPVDYFSRLTFPKLKAKAQEQGATVVGDLDMETKCELSCMMFAVGNRLSWWYEPEPEPKDEDDDHPDDYTIMFMLGYDCDYINEVADRDWQRAQDELDGKRIDIMEAQKIETLEELFDLFYEDEQGKSNCEPYNGWEDPEWRAYWGVTEDDPYDPFEGTEA